MQDINIIKKTELNNKSFRVAQVCDQYDFNDKSIVEKFEGKLDIPENWNIGVIVGKSGTGKSTIINEYFNNYICNFKYKENSVIDDFDKNIDNKLLFKTLSSVGFSSPPSWLKPYSVLSNGEKMRVDLARAILSDKEIIVFDEYTSVVDREVAQLGSYALSKTIRKTNKKFIAVTCHYDILDWLEPDWVFSTDKMNNERGVHRRPEIKLSIFKEKGKWGIFRKYHYLNHDLSSASHQYVLKYGNKEIGFCGIINMPHPKYSPMWKVHRLVILPDYQGLGVGIRFLNEIAKIYYPKYFGIVTSLNGFAKSLSYNKCWKLIRLGKITGKQSIGALNKTSSKNRNTYSFRYCPNT